MLVQDNLNIHKPASLYEAFPAPEARRLVERFEWHYTPKHGSWLDMAESELGVLASQCLDRRIADKQILAHEVTAWQDHRNKHYAKADWQFTTANARVKLKRLYPQFEWLGRLAAFSIRALDLIGVRISANTRFGLPFKVSTIRIDSSTSIRLVAALIIRHKGLRLPKQFNQNASAVLIRQRRAAPREEDSYCSTAAQ